jgi:DNA-binding NarL/FixJ family response regulator
MAITHRPMRAIDVRECVHVVATRPMVAARYGKGLNDLQAVWLGLLGREAFRAVVFEESGQSRTTIIGVGVSVFVSDEFLRSLKKPPFFWVGPELTRQIARGDSPLLSDRATRRANNVGGLNLLVWDGSVRAEFIGRAEVDNAVLSTFIEEHRGFLLKELVGQPPTRETVEATLRSGGQRLSGKGEYVDWIAGSLDDVIEMPSYVGLTREMALSRVGAWMASLFVHQAPRCGFRPSEQRLLLAALRGGTDKELADELGISLATVKKHWLSIYSRVSSHLPSLFANRVAAQEEGERGKEKKQHLIAYLREHPEELRPASP